MPANKANGSVSLSSPTPEIFLDELFDSESEFEKALIRRIPDIAGEVGVDSLLVIGSQVPLRRTAVAGRGLTLDVLAIDETGRLHVIELKLATEKHSVSQAYTYAAQLRRYTLEEIAEIYAAHLGLQSQTGVDVAIRRLQEFTGLESGALEDGMSNSPGIIVITPSVSAEEVATAEAFTSDGNEVVILLAVLLGNASQSLQLGLQRFFPSLDPATEIRPRFIRRARRNADGEAADGGDTYRSILETLAQIETSGDTIHMTPLRNRTGSRPDFTRAMQQLEERGHVIREAQDNGRKGRNPILIRITAEGKAFLIKAENDVTDLTDVTNATDATDAGALADAQSYISVEQEQ